MRNEIGITAKRDEVLAILRKNRENHSTIVKEAREGYAAAAEKMLLARLDEVRSGKLINLNFHLSTPIDYTEAYDDAIAALELHIGSNIELTGEQVRCYIRDKWDWRREFFGVNKQYSHTATRQDDGSL